MKFFAVLALLSAASADRLDKTYIPPNPASSGANAGLQTPFGPNDARGAPAALREAKSFSDDSQAEILRYDNEINEKGWQYAYETSNGIKADQQGRVIPGSEPETGSLYVSGSYSYVGDDGQTYTVTYTADENGYRAEGAHLPTPPPVPEEILRSLELTQQSQGQYDSQKSSYDADAGY